MQIRLEVTGVVLCRAASGSADDRDPRMSAPPDPLVRFGAFQLDLRTGELRKAGVRINLPDQPFQVLKTLLDRPGDLVTREELRQRLWPAETFVDFEHGLNAAVRRLRDALGDSADVPRFVETLPRRGYRFIAPVVRHLPPRSSPQRPLRRSRTDAKRPERLTPPAARRPTRMRRPASIAASVLVSAVVLWASGYLLWRPAASQSTPATTRFMLAVLPFENLTGDPDQEYISDGMTEELIAQLGGMDPSRLGVIARTSAMQFKKTTKRADQIGSDLGVSYLLEGSLRRTGSRIRIAVQLIETRERESTLGRTVRARRAGPVDASARSRGGDHPPDHDDAWASRARSVDADARRHSTIAEAYEHYLRGRYHWSTGHCRRASRRRGSIFRRAIDLDGSYALAYSGLADTYTHAGQRWVSCP